MYLFFFNYSKFKEILRSMDSRVAYKRNRILRHIIQIYWG